MTKKQASNAYMDHLFTKAVQRADYAEKLFGPHPNAEFTGCRFSEEAGEFIKACTSNTEKRHRISAMEEEAVDVMAMIIRMFRQWPRGIDEQ